MHFDLKNRIRKREAIASTDPTTCVVVHYSSFIRFNILNGACDAGAAEPEHWTVSRVSLQDKNKRKSCDRMLRNPSLTTVVVIKPV